MLQRAASNAYSWWSASHIRTKQSRWLNSSLLGMEDKVQYMLGIIENDNISGTCETDEKRKSELVSFVTEFYNEYKTLAEKYDNISGELQKANNVMASIFPEQAHFGMEDDDDGSSAPTIDNKTSNPDCNTSENQVPLPTQLTLVKNSISFSMEKTPGKQMHCSTMVDKNKVQGEIDKLQKEILVLQTEKEFVKSSFESGMARCEDIEKLIAQMQEKINDLMGNFNASIVIEDHEAQALMAITALRSCKTNLLGLHEQLRRSAEESMLESQNIKDVVQKLRAIKGQHRQLEPNDKQFSSNEIALQTSSNSIQEDMCSLNQEALELQSIYESIREKFKNDRSMFMLVEEINRLADKVIRMETRLSSQAAHIRRLRLDIVEIQKHLQVLEIEEKIFIHDLDAFYHNLQFVEETLNRVRKLDMRIQDENDQIRAHLIEAYYTFNDLSVRLQSPGEQNVGNIFDLQVQNACQNNRLEMQLRSSESNLLLGGTPWLEERLHLSLKVKISDDDDGDSCRIQEYIDQKRGKSTSPWQQNDCSHTNMIMQTELHSAEDTKASDGKLRQEKDVTALQDIQVVTNHKRQDAESEEPSLSNLQQLLQSGLDDREKILLKEYTSILRNYKETKRKLAEAEKKHQDLLAKTTAEMHDMKNVLLIKDEEIHSLLQKQHFLESCWNESSDFHEPELEGEHCRQVHATDEGSWFSIAFQESLDTQGIHKSRDLDAVEETDRRPLHVLDEDTLLPDNRQLVVEADEGCPFEELLIQEDHEPAEKVKGIPLSEKFIEYNIQKELPMTATEEKFRREIDKLLEENNYFWSRCTSSFDLKNEYERKVENIKNEISKLNEEKKQEGSSVKELPGEPESESVFKQLNDMQKQFSDWIEENSLLKEEVHARFLSLYNIADEISTVTKECSKVEEDRISTHHKAKFQEEVLRMQRENNKISEKLQEGYECVKTLQHEVTKMLEKHHESPKKSTPKIPKTQHSKGLAKRLPLRSFLFGTKTKKPALFHCMNQAMQKQYSDLAAGTPP